MLPTVWGTLYLFAGLMVLVTFAHVYLAKRYTFVQSIEPSFIAKFAARYLQDVKDDTVSVSGDTDPLLDEDLKLNESSA